MINVKKGKLYWITGLSGAGKTTIGTALYYKLKEENDSIVLLDGDILKNIVGRNTGYSLEARKERAWKYAWLCKMLVDQGMVVICCTIAMFDEIRTWNKENIDGYIEVFLDAPISILQERDQKGLYSKYNAGYIKELVGMDLDVELPKEPSLHIVNDGFKSIDQVVKMISDYKVCYNMEFDRDTEYWNNYYKNKKAVLEPTLFAQSMLTYMKEGASLVELGCGNGRDSIFFASNKINVTAIDASMVAIKQLRDEYGDKILFVCDDFVKTSALYQRRYEYCYSRFSLHAINDMQQKELIDNVYTTLKSDGLFFIEVRGVHDDIYGKGKKIGEHEYIYNNHYRRFIVRKELEEELLKRGFSIVYSAEEHGFAPYGDSNPKIIRVVAKK